VREKASFSTHDVGAEKAADLFVYAFARHLTARRVSLRLSQRTVARAVGASGATFCRWEAGKPPAPSLPKAMRWATVLGLCFPTAVAAVAAQQRAPSAVA